jgi:methyl-accepting chemotaxis protein
MAGSGNGNASSSDRLSALYEQAESDLATAWEEAVDRPSFGRLLSWSAENVAALTRIAADVADLTLRNLRVAGRSDITRLARQLNRTEDKLERVLQEVESLRDELERRGTRRSDGRAPAHETAGRADATR